ncbi:MAG: hypothetical protein IPK60_11775 [Sandaracinaceae bacterium]|nr:hypothetical protein [Sandaracinaceae bacterium]
MNAALRKARAACLARENRRVIDYAPCAGVLSRAGVCTLKCTRSTQSTPHFPSTLCRTRIAFGSVDACFSRQEGLAHMQSIQAQELLVGKRLRDGPSIIPKTSQQLDLTA